MKFPLLAALLTLSLPSFAAEIPRALPTGELPKDARLAPLKDYDGYFPFTPPATAEAWQKRADEVRLQMRVALGLYPEPTRNPLKAVVHGRIEQADYTVEKVVFETMPGFYFTGSLFRPKTPGKHPGVLCAHGHWRNARFWVRTDAEMKKELETGAEALPESGKSIFQSIGVQLARMGVVALMYDMQGDCDALQFSHELTHRFAKQRPEMNTHESWGLYSPQAESHAQNIMGIQTWNSMRALDFLTSLPDVDPKRLGCTGASGGGTQTLMVAALDPRLTVSVPCVMPSTSMQGGCTCENASLLRVGTGNIEIAALFAPKPQGITTAKDWTIEMPTKGFPELQQLYGLVGAKDKVALWHMPQFPHNYNSVTRHEIYRWFNTHFGLNLASERITERDYPLLTKEQLTVWDDKHPAPPGGDDFERAVLKWWHDDAQSQIALGSLAAANINGPAWRSLIGWHGPKPITVEISKEAKVSGGGKTYPLVTAILGARDGSFALPILEIHPLVAETREILWLDQRGKAGLFTEGGEIRPEVCRLLESGASVTAVDLFGQGEFQADGQPLKTTRRVKNPREAAAFTFGYNPSVFASRVHDVCQILSFEAGESLKPRSVIALDGTGPIAAVALAVMPSSPVGAPPQRRDKFDRAIIQTGGFRFADVSDLQSPSFQPAAAKYGDLPGAITLTKGKADQILILGEGDTNADPIAWLLEKK